MSGEKPLGLLGRDALSRFSQQGVDEEAAAHPDAPMDPPN
jgi:hypothetical protein